MFTITINSQHYNINKRVIRFQLYLNIKPVTYYIKLLKSNNIKECT
jgi:hypothetical protein